MRVAIAGSDPSLWTQWVENRFEQNAVRELLTNKAILCMPKDQWELTAKELARSILNPAAPKFMSELADLLRAVPLSEKVSQPPADALLDELHIEMDASPLGNAAVDETLQATFRARQSALDRARTRDSIYNEMVRPFASTAQRVRVLDPWAAHELSRDGDGFPWLVEQLVHDGIRHIEFLSRRDQSYPQGVDVAELKAVWQAHANTGLTLRLVMANPVGKAHDRHLRFFYPDGARMTPVVSLGHGVSVFEHPRFSTPPTIADISGSRAAAEERENAILRSNQFKTSIEFPEAPRPRRLVGPESAIGKSRK